MGAFGDYTKQLALFPTTVEDTATPPIITENRGKQRAKAKEISSSEMLVLMKEMREEMRIRDEQLKEEMRWRDKNQAAKSKRREENLEALI